MRTVCHGLWKYWIQLAPKDLISKSYTKFSFLQTIPVFDAGDKGDDGNSPPVSSDFRSISQEEGQRDFDDSTKNKNNK